MRLDLIQVLNWDGFFIESTFICREREREEISGFRFIKKKQIEIFI